MEGIETLDPPLMRIKDKNTMIKINVSTYRKMFPSYTLQHLECAFHVELGFRRMEELEPSGEVRIMI